MIEIGASQEGVSPELLHAPGGFAWWYVDVVTPGGDGAVLIWSYGLPFLPGYAAAARRGAAQLPVERPSVNLVVYRAGAPVFYLLQEHPPEGRAPGDLAREQRVAGCRFTRRGEGGRLVLEAELDCAVPGTRERLTGTVRVDGVARLPERGGAPAHAPHLWTPLTGPAAGEVSLDLGGRPLARLRGRAYHDRNGGRVPLHALGIERWMWGRIPLPESERIYYLLWPRRGGSPADDAAPLALGLEIGADGATRRVPLSVELGPARRALAGLRWPERVVLHEGGQPWLRVRHLAVADDGPFYLRLLSEGTSGGERALGWSEIVHPDRVDSDVFRPLVRMKVHRVGGPNSVWLPLFTGPRTGRVGRLLRGFLSPLRGPSR